MSLVGASTASAAPANGAALAQAAQQVDQVITQVRQGCGRGWHRNRWGRCRRN
jgi:hypothetical protein